MLHTVVVAGLWLVSTAALTESLWLESATAFAEQKSDCQHSKNHDVRIDGCSAMIQRNPNDVVAYHNRGDAYSLKGVEQIASDLICLSDQRATHCASGAERGGS
jgi:hypothetical protein